LALDAGEWPASRSGRFTLGVRPFGTEWTGGLVGPSVGVDAVAKKKITLLHPPVWDLTPVVQPVA